jgi:hypothetical protein
MNIRKNRLTNFAISFAVSFAVLSGEEEKPRLRETEWSKIIAEEKGGVAEFRLPDQSRVDVLTESTAYEVEWVEKWPEAIGQALFYGLSTDRAPGIILLMRGSKAEENYLECLSVVSALRQHFPIRLETIETE